MVSSESFSFGKFEETRCGSGRGNYEYPRLREAVMAIVSRVSRSVDEAAPARHAPQSRQWKPKRQSAPQVNATTEDGGNLQETTEELNSEAEEFEGELEVVVRKRAEIDKARFCARAETVQARETRSKDMKSRMACSACTAHGKTVFGLGIVTQKFAYNKNIGRMTLQRATRCLLSARNSSVRVTMRVTMIPSTPMVHVCSSHWLPRQIAMKNFVMW